MEANANQDKLLGDIRRLLSDDGAEGHAKGKMITVTRAQNQVDVHVDGVARKESNRPSSDNRRTRASS